MLNRRPTFGTSRGKRPVFSQVEKQKTHVLISDFFASTGLTGVTLAILEHQEIEKANLFNFVDTTVSYF